MLKLIRHAHFGRSVFVLSWLPTDGFDGAVEVRGVFSSRKAAVKQLQEIVEQSRNAAHSLSEWLGNVEIATYRWDLEQKRLVQSY